MAIVIRNQRQRIEVLVQKQGGDQKEVLHLYEWQMESLESQNKGLITEIRRLAKVQALAIQASVESLPSSDSQQLNLIERSVKHLRTTIQKLGQELEKSNLELESLRK